MNILPAKDCWIQIFQSISYRDLYSLSSTSKDIHMVSESHLKRLKALHYVVKDAVSVLSKKYRVTCHPYDYEEKMEPTQAKYIIVIDKIEQQFALNAIVKPEFALDGKPSPSLGDTPQEPTQYQCQLFLKLGATEEKIAKGERNSFVTWCFPQFCNLKHEFYKPVKAFSLTFPPGKIGFSTLEQTIIKATISKI